MAMAMTMSLRDKLKTLCSCGDGWSYAVFWRFHPQNSLMLMMEEAHYEEQLGEEIAHMFPKMHMLGEGIVGEAAFTGKHSWVHSDNQTQELNFTSQNISQDDSALHQQFCYGIKTIVVIPFKAWGVVQFGSKKKIFESVEFLEKIQSLLMEIDDKDVPDVLGNEFEMEFENFDLDGLLDCFSTENSHDWNLQYAHDEHFNELSKVYSSASSNDPLPSQCNIGQEGMASLQGDSSCLSEQLNGPIEAQVVLSNRESNDVLLNSLIDKVPCFDSWSGEISSFDLLGQQFTSDIRPQEVVDVCFAEENAFSSTQLPVQDSALTSLHSMNQGSFQDKLQTSLNSQHSSQSNVVTDVSFPLSSSAFHEFSENLEQVDMSEEFLKFSSMDDLCQWFAPSALDNTLSESIEFNPSSSIVGSNSSDIPVTCLTGNNSFNPTINSDGKETSVVTHSSGSNFLDGMELDLSFDQADDWWGNIPTPAVSAAATNSSFSQCLSEVNIGTMSSTGKRLFSELGIEELLRGESSCNPFNSSDFGYGLSPNKKQIVEFSPMNINPTNFPNLSMNEARANLMQPVSDMEKLSNLLSKKDPFPKSQVGLLNDDRHSIHIGKSVPLSIQKQKEHAKPTGRGARPKESTRPRPKDRQQIQDCIKELRGIIPSGGKCSIDSLLDRTIRYMTFLNGVVKYADKLQEPYEPKLINQANGAVPNDSSVGDRTNSGVTCAFEVAHQTVVCPVIVEDMSQPGQMLIEMLCEEQDFFLEIVDIIKGFGLNILKGKMELRQNKLWSRFIVEQAKPKRPNDFDFDYADDHSKVSRMNIIWSLLHLLQKTNTSGVDYANNHSNAINADIPYLRYQKQ